MHFTAYKLLVNQLLAISTILSGLFPAAFTSHLLHELSLLLLRPSIPLTSRPFVYTAADLHHFNNNHRLPAAAASAASKAGILRRRRYIHRSSGLSFKRHFPDGSPIPSFWTNSRPPVTPTFRTVNFNNLRSPTPAPSSISLALLNCRSLSNKSLVIFELILDNNLDLLLLCETWQQPLDYFSLNQATPSNYSYIAKPRLSGRGGGIAVFHKRSLSITGLDLNLPSISSFEYLAFSLPNSTTAVLIYRPPKSHPSFLSELSELLTIVSSVSYRLLLIGDFNIHIDQPTAPLTSDFISVLECFHLTQHITFPTHTKGHTLDIVCSSFPLTSSPRPLTFPLSDHLCILFSAPLPSPHKSTKRTISYRNIKTVNPITLCQLLSSALPSDPTSSSPDDLATTLNNILSDSLDSLAPWKTSSVTFTNSAPWYTPELRTMKQTGRQLERLYKKTRLTVHAETFEQHISSYRDALLAAKSAYFSSLINNTNRNPRILFSTINKLLQPPVTKPPSSPALCNSFLVNFNNKIAQINSSLTDIINNSSSPALLPPLPDRPPFPSLTAFSLVDSSTILDIITSSKTTTCSLDPLPTTLTKACLPVLLPHLTTLFNQSLSLGHFPAVYKLAAITPILKKPTLDPLNLSNYRPISNLSFLSKTLERIVSAQLHTHLQSNNLYEPFQSGFRPLHSTETALVKVTNDLLISADSGALNILLLLDLSAAFDTVNHSILLQRLRQLGVEGTALDWLTSYLTNRNHFISLSGHTSILSPVTQGVPQGSVLGPLLFICYLFPLGTVIRKLNLDFHCYADDTQIYIRTTPTRNPSLTHFETCISTIKAWLTHNFLKLNSDKTELLLIGTKSSLNKTGSITLTIDSSNITPSPLARNLGIIFDPTLSFQPHVSSVVKTSYFHLRRIAKIRHCLSLPAAESLIHAFISSRLDYCNSLLTGITAHSLHRLQLVQNSAARLLTHTRSREHITPVLHSLHWLPMKERIIFKILLLTFKALHHLAPTYLSDLLVPYCPNRPLRSSNTSRLTVPKSKLKSFGDRAFSCTSPRLWNSLPQSVCDSPTLPIFKSRLKTYLFSQAYDLPYP
ncbi:uncharacterized protein ACBT44_018929 isoform 1-T2 [Syngnathus typhle]